MNDRFRAELSEMVGPIVREMVRDQVAVFPQRIDVHVHSDGAVAERLDRIERLLRSIDRKESRQMADLNQIISSITEQTSKLDSLRVLIEQLKSLVDQGKVDEAFALLQNNTALMDALIANTPPTP